MNGKHEFCVAPGLPSVLTATSHTHSCSHTFKLYYFPQFLQLIARCYGYRNDDDDDDDYDYAHYSLFVFLGSVFLRP